MTLPLDQVSHSDVRELRGPLLVLGDAHSVGWDEYATVEVAGRADLPTSDTPWCWRSTTTW